jgi:hypothetical protein
MKRDVFTVVLIVVVVVGGALYLTAPKPHVPTDAEVIASRYWHCRDAELHLPSPEESRQMRTLAAPRWCITAIRFWDWPR